MRNDLTKITMLTSCFTDIPASVIFNEVDRTLALDQNTLDDNFALSFNTTLRFSDIWDLLYHLLTSFFGPFLTFLYQILPFLCLHTFFSRWRPIGSGYRKKWKRWMWSNFYLKMKTSIFMIAEGFNFARKWDK